MKVKLTTLLSGILLLVLTAGCEKNSPIEGTSPVSGGDAGQGACFSVMRAPEVLPGETELPEHAFSLWAWQRDSTETATPGVFDYVDALWVGTERPDGTVDPEFVYLRANSLWSTDKEHLWPDNYIACDFFGIYPADAATLDVSPRSGSHRPVRSISYDNSLSHYDLLVTSAMGKKETARAVGSLPLTFHHVLSKVSFKACRDANSPGPQVNVTVRSVVLCNIRQQGTFTFRDLPQSTPGNIDPVGWWTVSGDYADVIFYQNADGVSLTAAEQDYDLADTRNPQLLLPQVLTPWNTAVTIANNDLLATPGTYLKIGCTVTIDGYEGDFSDGGYVYVPFTPDWTMGKNYTYTLHFGGGYDKEGHVVLQPVTVTGTITPWTSGNTANPDESWL